MERPVADAASGGSKKSDQSFGLDGDLISKLDWERALARVIHDLKSDFIWAPHLRFLFSRLGQDIIDLLKSELKSGTFHPGIPLTMEVPKSFRIKIRGGNTARLGPSFSRPGSILPPKDRILYQVIADEAATIIDEQIDHSRSFSHQLADKSSCSMFLSARQCWGDLQAALKKHAENQNAGYILRLDVADYFGSINQHTLINTLKSYGFNGSLSDRLEKLLLSYTGQRSSRGILQGIYPSDLYGAFYMSAIDRFFDDIDVPSARYVDDIYIFVGSINKAGNVLRKLIPFLRSYDLNLNELKSTVMRKSALFVEEPDLDELFAQAVEEISPQLDEDDGDTGYGFQSDWFEDEDEDQDEDQNESDLELQATQALFDSIGNYPGHEESIERFCLPLFSKAESEYALDYVLTQLAWRPVMTQIYASYLGKFVNQREEVREALLGALDNPTFFDWQKMWIIATLMQSEEASKQAVKSAMSILSDATRHDALRAVAAVFVGRYGDHDRRKALFGIYKNVSEYVQLAIYFSSRSWPAVERKNARDSWGGHGQLHKIMSKGLVALFH
jgi:Reverse transcriptase (RNA-dependent DNA polymerase)